VRNTSCPKWHADTVRLRLLCTYAGPGTWFVANRCGRGWAATGRVATSMSWAMRTLRTCPQPTSVCCSPPPPPASPPSRPRAPAGRFVRRSLNPLTGDVAVAGVQGEHAQQAAAGDLLFLKGSSFPGLQGEVTGVGASWAACVCMWPCACASCACGASRVCPGTGAWLRAERVQRGSALNACAAAAAWCGRGRRRWCCAQVPCAAGGAGAAAADSGRRVLLTHTHTSVC
jgi:hypothetical protein